MTDGNAAQRAGVGQQPHALSDPAIKSDLAVRRVIEVLAQTLPYRFAHEEEFEVRVHPERAQRELLSSLVPEDGGHGSLVNAVRSFVESVSRELVAGDAFLKISYRPPDAAIPESPPSLFRLDISPRRKVTTRWGKVEYHARGFETRGHDTPAGRVLDPQGFVRVRVPRKLRRDLRRTLDAVQAEARQQKTLIERAAAQVRTPPGYDATLHRRLAQEEKLRRTRRSGWTGIVDADLGMLDPQRARRAIRLARTRVGLRDAALAGLQEVLERVGEVTGQQIRLTLENLITSEDLDDLEAALADGSRPMAELLRPPLAGPTVRRTASAS